jgi:O-antigen/teichoic acid export membrane protein
VPSRNGHSPVATLAAMAGRHRRAPRRFWAGRIIPIDQEGGGDRGSHNRSSDLSIFARLTSLKLMGSVANGVFGLLLIVVVTRQLHANRAGSFFAGIALFLIASNLAELGADTGFMRMIPRYRAMSRTQDLRRTLRIGLWPVLIVGTALGALVFAFASDIARLFFKTARTEGVVPYIRALAPFIPLSAASTVMLAATRGFGTITPSIVIDNIGKPALRPVLVVAVIAAGLGPTALGLAWASPTLPGLVLGGWWLWLLVHAAERRDRYQSGPAREASILGGEFWRFSGPRGLAGFSSTVLGWVDTLLVSALKGTGEAGVYTASIRLVSLGSLLSQAVVVVISPLISGLVATRDRDRSEALYHTATWWLMAATWPMFLTLAVFAPVVLSMFGPEFQHGQTVLLMLSLVNMLNAATGPVSAVLLMEGKSVWQLANTVSATTLNIVLNLLLIPRFGIVGAAAALSASITVLNVAALVETRMLLKVRLFGAGAPVVAAASVLCFAGGGLLIRTAFGLSVQSFVLFLTLATGVYMGLLWRYRELLQFPVLLRSLRPGRRSDRPAN